MAIVPSSVASQDFRKQLAKLVAEPISLRARSLAAGQLAGMHRSVTKGAGVEFAGHRAYSPGDDLRHLDRHAQLRHNRLLIRQFETETERSVHIVCDVTASMAYAEKDSPESSKLERALLLSASLAFLANGSGDQFGLTLISEQAAHTEGTRSGRVQLERTLGRIESTRRPSIIAQSAGKDMQVEGVPDPELWQRTLSHLGQSLGRGSIIYVLSDFFDLNPALSKSILQLCTRSRTVRALQLLTPTERDFPFEGALKLFNPETGTTIQTDGRQAQAAYKAALAALSAETKRELERLGGVFMQSTTADPPEAVLSALARGIQLTGTN